MKKIFIILLVAIFILLFPIKIFGSALFEEDFEACSVDDLGECTNWTTGGYWPPNSIEVISNGDCVEGKCVHQKFSSWGKRSSIPALEEGILVWDFKFKYYFNVPALQYWIGDFRAEGSPLIADAFAELKIITDPLDPYTDVIFQYKTNSEWISFSPNPPIDEHFKVGFEWDLSGEDKKVRYLYIDTWTDWIVKTGYEEGFIYSFGALGTAGGQNFSRYWDNFGMLGDPPPEYEDWGGSASSSVGSVKILYREYTGTPPLFKWGYKVTGFNPEKYDYLDVDIWNFTSSYATSTFKLETYLYTIPWIFERHAYLKDYPEDTYTLKFNYRNSETSATSSIFSYQINLSTELPQYSEEAYLIKYGFIEDEFEDKWGLGALFKSNLDKIKLKFPISWYFEIKDIWDAKIEELGVAEAVDPISVSWTIPTSSVIAFSNRTFAIFDLKGANNQYGSQIGVFRTIMVYIFWLSTFMVVLGKTKRFFTDLGD